MHVLDVFFFFIFYMQVYIMIHLMNQINTLDALYLRSMFPYKRFVSVLKAYETNQAHLYGSIIWKVTQQKKWSSVAQIT